MARIFLSHSSHDNLDAGDIKAWLAARGFSLIFLDFDKENGIEPGADWEKTLYREVDRAQALVLILTQNWLASKWCFAEFTQARALGKEIVPLVLVPDLKTVIGRDLQSINLTVDRAAGLERLEKKLRELSQHSPEGLDWPSGVAPYPGLNPFEENRAAVFYGRDDEIRQGLNRLNRSRTFGSPELQLLLGASGSGKSSLLRAGLVPRLKRDPTNWIVLSPFRPGRAPEAKLIDCLLLALDVARHDPAQGAAWRAVLASSAPSQALTEIVRALRFQHGALDASIFLPIDQLEEAFTVAGAEDAAKFFDLLMALLDPALPFVVLAALRDDHLDQLQRNANLAVAENVFSLGPMPLERIGALVRGPARMAGLKIDDELVTTLTQDARTGDALPLIAFALEDLYQRVGRDKAVLTLADYEALGDRDKGIRPLENAVRKRAEEALSDLASHSDQAQALRAAFIPALVRASPETGAFTRRPAPLAALPPTAKPLIERLIDARLLVRRFSESAGESVVEVSHEALFRVWPLLADWLREERAFLQGKGRFDQSFTTWRNLAKSAKVEAVLGGLELDQNLAWLKERPARFTPEETAYIHASDRARRAQRYRTWGLISGIFVVLLAGLAGSSFFYIQQRNATEQAQKSLTAAIETANDLIFDLARKFRSQGLPNDMVREILNRAQQLLVRLTEGNEADPALQRSQAVALDELSHTLADYGDPESALSLARQALTILQKLAALEPRNMESQRDLALSLDRIGDILGRNDPVQAQALYEEGLAIRQKLVAQDPGNNQLQGDLSLSLDRIGDSLGHTDPGKALALYRKGLELRRKLAELEPVNSGFQDDISVSLNKIGDILTRSDPAQALSSYQEALAIRRKLAAQIPRNTQFQHHLALSLDRLGDIVARGDPSQALALYQEGLMIRRKLAAQELGNTAFQRNLSRNLNKIGDILVHSDPVHALALYQEGLALRRKLAAQEPGNMQFQRDLSVSLFNVGDFLAPNDPVQTLAIYHEGLAIQRKLASDEPGNRQFQRDLSVSLEKIGIIQSNRDPMQTLALYQEGLAIAQTLAAQEPGNIEFQTDLIVSLVRLASAGERPEKHYSEALAILSDLNARGLLSADQSAWVPEIKTKLAEFYGNQAYGALFDKDFTRAEQRANAGLGLDARLDWIKSNLAHALMFQNRIAEADAIYFGLRGTVVQGKPWEQLVEEDFTALRDKNIQHPHMAEIEAAFRKRP